MVDRSRRPAMVAGQFYPGDADVLRRQVRGYLKEAQLPAEFGQVRAVVAPHAGYVYSGPTAGYAYKALSELPDREWTVYLMGPAHRVYVRGVALGGFSAFETPLGEVPVATERIEALMDRASFYVEGADAHRPEHSLEVQLPFLQTALADFKLVPMLFGEVDTGKVVEDLKGRLGPDDLVVVSSDLSHFHDEDQAERLDRSLLDALLEGDVKGVVRGEACGRAPIATLMGIAKARDWTPHLLDYSTSADATGDRSRVVGYASVAYSEVEG